MDRDFSPLDVAREMDGQHETVMTRCTASGCANYDAGLCSLTQITINDRGGCEQYEANADDADDAGDGRYEEREFDQGDSGMGLLDPMNGNWVPNKFDPRGGGTL